MTVPEFLEKHMPESNNNDNAIHWSELREYLSSLSNNTAENPVTIKLKPFFFNTAVSDVNEDTLPSGVVPWGNFLNNEVNSTTIYFILDLSDCSVHGELLGNSSANNNYHGYLIEAS
jgi:hypothetical protein